MCDVVGSTVEAEPANIVLWDGEQHWRDLAACAGMASTDDLFFPERGEPTSHAKAVCKGCPVRAECLDFAMANNEQYGVWGGLSGRERRQLRRQLNVRTVRPRTPAACGTDAGYAAHRRRDEAACRSCTLAHNDYQRRHRAAESA